MISNKRLKIVREKNPESDKKKDRYKTNRNQAKERVKQNQPVVKQLKPRTEEDRDKENGEMKKYKSFKSFFLISFYSLQLSLNPSKFPRKGIRQTKKSVAYYSK